MGRGGIGSLDFSTLSFPLRPAEVTDGAVEIERRRFGRSAGRTALKSDKVLRNCFRSGIGVSGCNIDVGGWSEEPGGRGEELGGFRKRMDECTYHSSLPNWSLRVMCSRDVSVKPLYAIPAPFP